jgi:xanthine dehydrogenase molybdopterin-binding subunit B
MDEAIKNDSFHSSGEENIITNGDPLGVLESSEVDHVVEGEVRIGGQEHFYLETNVTLVKNIPTIINRSLFRQVS